MKERRLINAAIDIHLTPDTQVECRATTGPCVASGFQPLLVIGSVGDENACLNIWPGIDRLCRLHQVIGAYLAAHDIDIDDDTPDGSSDRVDVVPAEAVAAAEDLPPGWVRDLDGDLRHPSRLVVMSVGCDGRPGIFDLYREDERRRIASFPREGDAIQAAEAILHADAFGSAGVASTYGAKRAAMFAPGDVP